MYQNTMCLVCAITSRLRERHAPSDKSDRFSFHSVRRFNSHTLKTFQQSQNSRGILCTDSRFSIRNHQGFPYVSVLLDFSQNSQCQPLSGFHALLLALCNHSLPDISRDAPDAPCFCRVFHMFPSLLNRPVQPV